jgi:hypothetical protein
VLNEVCIVNSIFSIKAIIISSNFMLYYFLHLLGNIKFKYALEMELHLSLLLPSMLIH